VRLFGEKIGIAFQIRDDLFDLGYDDVGKPLGIDIKEKKLTLPVIFALKKAERKVRNEMINNIRRYHDQPEKVRQVIEFVRNSGGLEYARDKMYVYRQEALDILFSFPESPARQSLADLIAYVTERDK
jgi:octaprenyl-diphosphate synthase